MEWLNEYVIRLCAVSVVIMGARLILPKGALKNCAERAMSLILLYAVAQPLLMLLSR